MKIPIAKPLFDQAERDAILEPLESGWLVQGPKVKAFEAAVAAFAGARHAYATTSCTTSLHAALVACGIGAGDEVIVPAFTFVASANAVEYVGAKPVFVDIDLRTFNLDTTALARAIGPRTRAIMPVHLFGLSADMDPIMQLARSHNLRVIEDAACGIGARYKGTHVGTIGDAGCFSFHPRKSITTGEGGMVLTDDDELGRTVELLRDHGSEVTDLVRHHGRIALLPEYNMVGFNYRMTDLQGALGVAQMAKLPLVLERKAAYAAAYTDGLASSAVLRPPAVPEGYVHGYQAYVCLYAPGSTDAVDPDTLARWSSDRDALMGRLSDNGVSTRQGTHAVHALGYYRKRYDIDPWDFPNAWIAEHLAIALPLYPAMTDEEFAFVLDQLRAAGA